MGADVTDEVPQFPRGVLAMTPRTAAIYWALRLEAGRRIAAKYENQLDDVHFARSRFAGMHPYPDPDPCVMRPDQPHVCRRADHDERHGKTTPREPS